MALLLLLLLVAVVVDQGVPVEDVLLRVPPLPVCNWAPLLLLCVSEMVGR
jgi:hypothetical protein